MKRLFKKADAIELNADDKRSKDEDLHHHENDHDADDMPHHEHKHKHLKDLEHDDLDKKPFEEKPKHEELDPTLRNKSVEDKVMDHQTPPMLPSDNLPNMNPNPTIPDGDFGHDLKPLEEGLLDDMSALYVLYQQTKFFHWIINDSAYIATHRFLDEIATGVLETIDLLAERLVYIHTTPIADFEQLKFRSYVPFEQQDGPFKLYRAIDTLDRQFSQVIDGLKNNCKKASEKGDIGTEKLIQDSVYDLETFQHHIQSFR